MDCNIFSFHGCTDEHIEMSLELIKPHYNNIHVLKYDSNMKYTETFRDSLSWVKENGFTDFLFTQDDTFTTAPKEIIDSVFEIYNSNDLKMLHLGGVDDYVVDEVCNKDIVHGGMGVNIYHSNTQMWRDKNKSPFGDSPYICSVDLLDEIYKKEYFEHENIQQAEGWFKNRVWDKPMPRWQVDVNVAGNISIVGINKDSDENIRKLLKKVK